MPVFFTWIQDWRREMRFVDGIGKILCFKSKAPSLPIFLPELPLLIVDPVGRVELKARLGGIHFKRPSRGRIISPCCKPRITCRVIEYPVMVVTCPKTQLFVVQIDIPADFLRTGEIERSSLY